MISRRFLNIAFRRRTTLGGSWRFVSPSTAVPHGSFFVQKPSSFLHTPACVVNPLLRSFSTQLPRTFYLDKYEKDQIQRELDKVEKWLKEADEVSFGKRSRGLAQVKKRMDQQESERRNRPYHMTRKRASKFCSKLIYRRHALLHGVWNLKELTNAQLAKTFLGEDTNRKIPHKEAEFIIRQQWKFGKSEYLEVKYLGEEPEEGSKMTIELANKIKRGGF